MSITELTEMNSLMKEFEKDIYEMEKFNERLKELLAKDKSWNSFTKNDE